LFDYDGRHFKPRMSEIAMPITFKIGDIMKVFKVKKVSEYQASIEPNYVDANEAEKNPTIKIGTKSLSYLGVTSDED
jgi:hypothetical protein